MNLSRMFLIEIGAVYLIFISVGASALAGILIKAVTWAIGVHAEFRVVQQRVNYLWPIAKQDAIDTLHHADQPVFDNLLDRIKAGSLTEAQRDQVIERTAKIASGEAGKPEQALAAALLHYDAQIIKTNRATETGTTNEPGSLSKGQQLAVNREQGEAMASEGAASANPGKGEEAD